MKNLIYAAITELSFNAIKEQLRKVFWDLILPVSSNVSVVSSSQVFIELKEEVAFETTNEGVDYSLHCGSNRPAGPGRIFCGHFRSIFCGRSTFTDRVRGHPFNPTHTSKTTDFTSRRNPIKMVPSPNV